MKGGISERKRMVRAFMCASLNRPRSFVREMWKMRKTAAETSGCVCKDYIVKYSVDPALTDIRGEFPRQAEANLGGNAGCRSLAWGAAAFFVSQEIPMELPVKQKGTACLRCTLARR